MKHGTGGYTRGCRCQECRDATAAYRRNKRAPKKKQKTAPPPKTTVKTHGTTTGYARGCRCQECRDAQAAYQRIRRAPLAEASRAATRTTTGYHGGPGTAFGPGATRYIADLPPTVRHGTASAYKSHYCRCRPCTDAVVRSRRTTSAESGQ